MKRLISFTLFAIASLLATVGHAGSLDFSRGNGSMSMSRGNGTLSIPAGGSTDSVPDGLIGNTTINDANTRTSNTFFYTSFTVTTAGRVAYCHGRFDPTATSDDFTIGLYQTNGTLLAYANVTNVGSSSIGWYGGALNTPIILTAGSSYIIGAVANQSINIYKDASEAGHYRRRITMTYGSTLASADFSTYTSDSESNAMNFQCDNSAATP